MEQHLLKNGEGVIIREATTDDAREIEDVVNSVASEKYLIVAERLREDWDETRQRCQENEGSHYSHASCWESHRYDASGLGESLRRTSMWGFWAFPSSRVSGIWASEQ
jgi:hypothetical protein